MENIFTNNKLFIFMTRNTITLVFLLFFISAMLISPLFILIYENHEHDHNGIDGACAICSQLQNAENLLKQLNLSAYENPRLLITAYLLAISLGIYCLPKFQTLINLKVRLND